MNQQDIEQVVKAVLLKMQSSDTPPAAVHEMGVSRPWMTPLRQPKTPSKG